MEEKKLIGLTVSFGKSAFEAIVASGIKSGDSFVRAFEKFMSQYQLRRNPWEPAANFIRDEIIPVMDKENELECYTLMYLIRHLGDNTPQTGFEEDSEWVCFAKKENESVQSPFPYDLRYIDAVLNGLLDGEGVKGTTLERYLRFPEELCRERPGAVGRTGLFAVTYEL